MYKKIIAILIGFGFLAFQGCNEKEFNKPGVITEQILWVSGELIRISGRILSTQNFNAEDHGFEVSSNSDMSLPITISLGPINSPGLFIGQTNGLDINSSYFVRSYIKFPNEIITGNILEVKTLLPGISSFSPTIGETGGSVTILGRNFTSTTKVFFGEQEATVTNIQAENIMTVTIPTASSPNFIVPVRVVTGAQELLFNETFEYVIGQWSDPIAMPGNLQLNGQLSFSYNDQMYFGLGRNGSVTYSDFWRFEPISKQFAQVSYPGFPIQFGSFVFEGGFGSGVIVVNNQPVFYPAIWKLNTEGTAFEQVGAIPRVIYQSIAKLTGNKLLLIGGTDSNRNPLQEINEYDITTQTLTRIGSLEMPISNALPHYLDGNVVYFINESSQLWAFDLVSRNYTLLSTYPGTVLTEAFMQKINTELFVGMGREDLRMWRFDLNTRIWKSVISLRDFNRSSNSASWTFQQKLFFLRRASNMGQFTNATNIIILDPFDL